MLLFFFVRDFFFQQLRLFWPNLFFLLAFKKDNLVSADENIFASTREKIENKNQSHAEEIE